MSAQENKFKKPITEFIISENNLILVSVSEMFARMPTINPGEWKLGLKNGKKEKRKFKKGKRRYLWEEKHWLRGWCKPSCDGERGRGRKTGRASWSAEGFRRQQLAGPCREPCECRPEKFQSPKPLSLPKAIIRLLPIAIGFLGESEQNAVLSTTLFWSDSLFQFLFSTLLSYLYDSASAKNNK